MIESAAYWSQPSRCLRHRVWLASCDDCTAWQLSRQIAARDAVVLRPRFDRSVPVLRAVA